MMVTGRSLCSEADGFTGPRSRCKHATCLHDGVIYVSGGRDGNVPLSDLWSYTVENSEWKVVKLTGDKLPALQEHSMIAHKNYIYIFGGSFAYGSDCDVPLWEIDIGSFQCTKLSSSDPSEVDGTCSPSSRCPVTRRGHSAVIHSTAMYVYGGYIDMKGSTGEMWKFDFVDHSWQLVKVPALYAVSPPAARHSHSAVVHRQRLWVYGGLTDLQPLSDLWTWHFDVQRWSQVRCRLSPPALEGHSASIVGNSMLIFGGCTDGVPQNSLWEFDFDFLSWTQIAVQGLVPGPCTKHCTITVARRMHSSTRRNFSMPTYPSKNRRSFSSSPTSALRPNSRLRSSLPLQKSFTAMSTVTPLSLAAVNDHGSSRGQLAEFCGCCSGTRKRSPRIGLTVALDDESFNDNCYHSTEQLIVPDRAAVKCKPAVKSSAVESIYSHCSCTCHARLTPVEANHCRPDGDACDHDSGYSFGLENPTFNSDNDDDHEAADDRRFFAELCTADAETEAATSNHIIAARTLMIPVTSKSSGSEISSPNRRKQPVCPPAVEMTCYSSGSSEGFPVSSQRHIVMEDLESGISELCSGDVHTTGCGDDGMGSGDEQRRKVRDAWVDFTVVGSKVENNRSLEPANCENSPAVAAAQEIGATASPKQQQPDYVLYIFGGRMHPEAPNVHLRPITIHQLDVNSAR